MKKKILKKKLADLSALAFVTCETNIHLIEENENLKELIEVSENKAKNILDTLTELRNDRDYLRQSQQELKIQRDNNANALEASNKLIIVKDTEINKLTSDLSAGQSAYDIKCGEFKRLSDSYLRLERLYNELKNKYDQAGIDLRDNDEKGA